MSSDEEHLARHQPFIVCHQYHLDNDLSRPVAMATVICMEMMLVLAEDEDVADVGGIKREVRRRHGHGEKKAHVLLLFGASCVIIQGFVLKCVDEHVCQQGTLWQRGEDWAVVALHHVLNTESTRELVAMRQLSSYPRQFCCPPFI